MIPISRIMGRLGNSMFQYAYLYGQMRAGRIQDIYVQNPIYWEMYEKEILNTFSEGIIYNNYVGIHVRRGDYVNNPFYHDLMKTDYYKRAMEWFPGETFKVYSDDIEWCKQQEIFKDCVFSKETNEIADFNHLAGSRAVIGANSSFSWWAGLLCRGRAILPQLWLTDGTSAPKHDKFIML